jgi:signal transduction histidine kinase
MARLDPAAAQHTQERVALVAVALSVVRELAPLGSQGSIRLHVARAEAAGVRGAEDALRLLVTNLVDNALRYTAAGGEVQVSTWTEHGAAILQVSDDGPGIPPAERERVFDRFYRGAGAPEGGSGLGLAIVRRVAELHGGRVELGDGLRGRGLGARFIVPAP